MADITRVAELCDHLGAPEDPVAVARIWRGVGRARQARRARRRLAAACSVAMAVGLGLGLLGAHLHGRAGLEPGSPGPASGPLRLASGDPLPVRLAATASARDLDLSDGSALAMDPGSRLEVLGNGPGEVAMLLGGGRVGFAVRPNGPRRWTIDCGLATVEVVGTRFVLDRGEAALLVAVSDGAVWVRGERVRGGARRLGPGDELVVDGAAEERVEEPACPAVAAAAGPEEAPRAAAAPAWRRAALGRDYGRAYELLGPAGLAAASREARSVEELLALADVARNSGHPEEALLPLDLVVSEHRRDARAPLAAFTLGRLCLDRLDRPGRAARAFGRALELGLPRALVEDAMYLEVVSSLRAGDAAGARRAARAYLARFPEGPHAAEVLEAAARGEGRE